MDEADIAFSQTEKYINECIKNGKSLKTRTLKPVGFCHYCTEDVVGDKLFCNGDCSSLYNKSNKRQSLPN